MDEEKQVVEEGRGLTFKDILFIVRKHWIAIIVFIFLGTAAGFTWTKVEQAVKPVYQSTGTMLVSYDSGKDTAITTEYNFSNYITNTYVAFIKEEAVLSKAADKLNENKALLNKPIEYTAGNLKSNLSVGVNSLILKVSFTASDPDDAKTILQTIIDTASEVADSPKLDEAGNPILDAEGKPEPKYKFLNGNLTPVSEAKRGRQVSHTTRNTAIGLAAGVAAAFIYVVLRELLDNKFKSSEEVERMLGVPVLAGIPDYHFDDEKKGGK